MTYISQKPTTKGISFPPSLVLANVYIILFNFSFFFVFFLCCYVTVSVLSSILREGWVAV